MIDAPIKSLVAWFGAKRTLARTIVEEIGQHRAFWDVMCGSMSIIMAKPESSHETVNDLHGDLINLARVIQDPADGAKFYRRLRRTLVHESLWRESIQALGTELPPLDRAHHYFVVSWFGQNGRSGTPSYNTTSFAVRWTPNGGHGGKRFASAVNSIPSWRRRMRRLTILQRDAFGIIEKIDDTEGCVIYADPPYIEKGAKYVHDFDPEDHIRLADSLGRFKLTRVVLSYYDHPLLDELYPSWTKRDVSVTKNLVNAAMRGAGRKVKAPEVLLINGPSYAKCGTLFSEPTNA